MEAVGKAIAVATETPPASVQAQAKDTPAQSEEKAAPKTIKSYQDEVWLSSWKRRSAGMWAGALCGAGFGGGIGAVAALATFALYGAGGFLTLGAMMAAIVPAMAVLGIGLGIGAFTVVGATSGAVAHGLKEQDRRMDGKIVSTEKIPQKKVPFFNWKVAVAGFALAAPVGWLFAATGAAAALSGAVLTPLAGPALTCLSVMTFGLNGAIFGFNGPKISKDATNMMGAFLSGKIFEKKKGSEMVPEIALPEKKEDKTNVKTELAFKSDSVKTLVTPIGSYAGKEAGFHTRRLAEQQFNAMDPRTTIPH